MSVNEVNKTTGETSLVAGGTLYADAPIGAILAFGGATAPAGWMICNGAAVSRTTYAALFAAIGTAFGAGDGSTTFNIPDLREATTKGAGETGQTVGAHVKSGGLAVGEFIDDRVEKHTHFKTRAIYASSGVYEAISENGSTDPTNDNQYNTGRSGDTTEVKAVGVNYIIKAQQVALPADFATELDKKQNITDNTLETDSKTVPGAINEIKSDLANNMVSTETKIGTLDGTDVYRRFLSATSVSIQGDAKIDSTFTKSFVDKVLRMSGTARTSDRLVPITYTAGSSAHISIKCANDGLYLDLSGFTVIEYLVEIIYTKAS